MNNKHVNDSVIAIKQVIDENPLSRESLKVLAPDIHIGRNQLQSAFKQLTGMTMRRYRMKRRMEAAAEMLATGQYTIKEVAISSGHACDQSSFSKIFRAIHNMAPEEWVRKNASINKVLLLEPKIKKCI